MSYKDVIDLLSGETQSKKRRSIIQGLLIGSAIGVGSSLLLAPRSGRATRQRLVDGAANVGLSLQAGSIKTVNRLKTTVDNLTTNAKAIATDVSHTTQAVQESMKNIQVLRHTLERNARQLSKQSVDARQAGDRLSKASENLQVEADELKDKMT